MNPREIALTLALTGVAASAMAKEPVSDIRKLLSAAQSSPETCEYIGTQYPCLTSVIKGKPTQFIFHGDQSGRALVVHSARGYEVFNHENGDRYVVSDGMWRIEPHDAESKTLLRRGADLLD